MNTRKDLARLFDADFDWALARRTGLEQYCKPWPLVRRGVAQVERHLPTSMWMALVVLRATPARLITAGIAPPGRSAVVPNREVEQARRRPGVDGQMRSARRPRHVRKDPVGASSQRVMALTIVDQGASSVSNFALAVIVAHYSSASALGVFAILTSTYVLSQGLVRSLSSDCLLTRSETDDGLRSTYERAGYLAAIVLSVSLAVVIVADQRRCCRARSPCRSSSSPSPSR